MGMLNDAVEQQMKRPNLTTMQRREASKARGKEMEKNNGNVIKDQRRVGET